MSHKPKIGVSRCLLGDAVRYDGNSKPNIIIIEELSKLFEFVAVCPEVEAGLPVPRPPVQLSGDIVQPRLTGRDDHTIDVTDLMLSYCRHKPKALHDLCGFIFKSRSPSCGLNSTPVFIGNKIADENSRGVFARALCENMPSLPVIEETDLESDKIRLAFIAAVKGTSINCLRPLRDLKQVAARREPQQNGYSILKVHNAADACFRSRPTGLYTRLRLSVALS